jgi:hypothetical protein
MKKFQFVAVAILAGIAIGLRFKILIIAIATSFATTFVIIFGIMRADDFWSIFLTAITVMIAIQLGYLGGTAIVAMVASFFPPKQRDHNSDQD